MADFDVPPGIMQLALTVSRILAYGREGFDVFRHCINSSSGGPKCGGLFPPFHWAVISPVSQHCFHNLQTSDTLNEKCWATFFNDPVKVPVFMSPPSLTIISITFFLSSIPTAFPRSYDLPFPETIMLMLEGTASILRLYCALNVFHIQACEKPIT